MSLLLVTRAAKATTIRSPSWPEGHRCQCSKCGHDDRVGAKFCEEGATSLARTCASCGTQFSPTAKFCSAA